MIKHKWIGVAAALLMAAAVLATGYAYMNPSVYESVARAAQPAYATAMDKTKIMSIQIVADENQWARMLENATAEEYIPATITIDGTKLENVGIRPKGNSSLSTVARDSTSDRFSFKIEFDHYITGQTWLGLDKLAVNNMQGDASYMKEYISYDIMEYTGVAAPLTAFADISVNGDTWGFYLAVECLEDSYAQRVYGNGHGMLYKPESMGMRGAGRMNEFIEEMQNAENAPAQNRAPDDARSGQPQAGERGQQSQFPGGGGMGGGMDQNAQGEANRAGGFPGGGMGGGMGSFGGVSLQYTGDDVSDYSAIFDNAVFDATERDYRRVVKALENLSNGESLESTVDVEAVLKYFAAHTVVVNLDSYVSNMGHNYYLYEENGRLTILPWDYNLAFGGFQSGGASSVVNFPIDTPVSGVSLSDRPLLGKLLEVPEYAELYHGYLRQIVDGYFNGGLFERTVDSLRDMISPYVENDPTAFNTYEAYEAAVVELKKLGLLRAQSIEGQLDGTVPSTSAGQSAEPEKLVAVSAVNFSALGGQGGGMFGGNRDAGRAGSEAGATTRIPDGAQGMDWQALQRAMEIFEAAAGDALTAEQLSQLKELGLTDEQISRFESMMQQGGFGADMGGFGGGMDGFGGDMGGRRSGGQQGAGNDAAWRNPGFEGSQLNAAAGAGISAWLLVGGCTALLLLAMLFALRFRRRAA